MSSKLTFLITLLQKDDFFGHSLLKVAVKCDQSYFQGKDWSEFRMASDKAFFELLPLHCRSVGPIVDIEEIFDLHEVNQ